MYNSNNDIQLISFDWAIKTVLSDKANFDILEGFLSALLNEDIIIEQIIDSESNAELGYKFNRVDLLVHDIKHRKIIIEIQNDRETHYLERLLFGTSKVIVENIELGDKYNQVAKVISISILYYNLGVGNDYVYTGITEERSRYEYYVKATMIEHDVLATARQEDEQKGKLEGKLEGKLD